MRHLSNPMRRAVTAGLLAAALLGSAAAVQLGGQPTANSAPASTAPAGTGCPKNSTLVRVAGRPGGTCEPLNQPETFADLQALNDSQVSRSNAPFNTAAPGAYQAALAAKASTSPAGTAPGTGAAWAPYGSAPECAGPSTVAGGPCPAASAANGNYSNVGGLGFRTLSGRISSFAYDPTTAGRYFASPTAGGVYESLDGGNTWHSIGDNLATQMVGAIAYDVPLHKILVGTGDNSFGGSGIGGHGFWTSTDDGATWASATGFPDLALSFRVVVSPADATGSTIYVASSKGLFKSTDGGATLVNENLPTTPAGYSPNCKGDTTTPLCFFANIVTDVVVKGKTSANAPAGAVMAVVGWRAGEKGDTNPDGTPNMSCKLNGTATQCLQAPQNGLYISSSGAPGSFTFSDQGQTASPTTTTGFAPDTVVGRTALGIAHGTGQDNDAVYAIVEDATKFQGCPDALDTGQNPTCNSTITGLGIATYLDGMYASYDFGKSWTKIMDYTQTKYPNTGSSLLGQTGYSPGVQSWYNLWVEPDPSLSDSNGDPERVAFGLEEIWENNQTYTTGVAPNPELHEPYQAQPPGGAVANPWVVIGRYWNACAALNSPVNCNQNASNNPIPGTTTHPDQHAALFVPDAAGGGVTLFAGSDGGVYKQHVASGSDFSNDNWGDGQNLGIYSQQPYDAEISKDGTVVAGLQDNGEDKFTPAGKQAEIYGGDAFFNTIDPNNSNNILEEYTYGSLSMSTDGGTTWNAVSPGTATTNDCGSTTALFSTPIEQDPTMPGHIVVGCTTVEEAVNTYGYVCPTTATVCSPFAPVFNLSTAPGGATNNIPSAVGVQGASIYVGYCGYCDVVTGGLPFHSGIATNVGGTGPPTIGSGSGWHFASGNCANCGTPDGKLPQRYITSIQMDPTDSNTVYVTMGGYGRRWIPPGSLGDDTSHLGTGHVFVSHDAGNSFTDITGNLPDISANWTLLHNGNLVVATDLGVFESTGPNGGTFGQVGTGLPNVPVFTIRTAPNNPQLMIAATYGRSVYKYTFTDTPPTLPQSRYVSLPPSRVLDTRLPSKGSCTSLTGAAQACATLGTNGTMSVQITGASDVTTGAASGVPNDGTVTAVAMNVTATDTTANSFLTVWPKGAAQPTASNLNFTPGQVVPNFTEVPVSSDGKVSVYNLTGNADVVFDIAGYYTTAGSGTAGLFRPLPPSRIMDTRQSTAGCTTTDGKCTTLGQGQSVTLQVTGAKDTSTGNPSGVPNDGTVDSVVLNLTVTNPTGSGFLTAYPGGQSRPFASNVNFVPGQSVPNRAIVKLDSSGRITLFNNNGNTDVVVDVGGYYTTATATGTGGQFTPVVPARVLDTRAHKGSCGSTCATIAANSSMTLNIAGVSDITTHQPTGVPSMSASTPPTAVVLNVTAVNGSHSSFLTIYPDGAAFPPASDLNFVNGQTVPNLVVVKLGPNGDVTIYNEQGTVDVVVDVEGWYS